MGFFFDYKRWGFFGCRISADCVAQKSKRCHGLGSCKREIPRDKPVASRLAVGVCSSLRTLAGELAVGFLPELDDALTAESLTTLKRNFGLAPRIYRAQLLRPDLVDAQV